MLQTRLVLLHVWYLKGYPPKINMLGGGMSLADAYPPPQIEWVIPPLQLKYVGNTLPLIHI